MFRFLLCHRLLSSGSCDSAVHVQFMSTVRPTTGDNRLRGRASRRRPWKLGGSKHVPNVGIRHTLNAMAEEGVYSERDFRQLDPEDVVANENEFDEEILKAGDRYDDIVREKEKRRFIIKQKIIERKYYRKPQEKNLLTVTAKAQLRHLHEMDPEMWTPEKLARSFPISVDGVKKLLKSSYLPSSEEDVLKHDSAILKKWKTLNGGKGGPITTAVIGGSPLQSSDPRVGDASQKVGLIRRRSCETTEMLGAGDLTRPVPSRAGEFELMLQKPQATCGKTEGREELPLPDVALAGADLLRHMEKALRRGRSDELLTFNEMSRKLQSGDSSLRARKAAPACNNDDSGERVMDAAPTSCAEMGSVKAQEDKSNDDILNYFSGGIQKYKEVSMPNIKWDVRRGIDDPGKKEAYIYDAKHGYQWPFGSYKNE